jgi:hypothetical protein
VESESGRDTSAVGGPNVDGSYDYGLFQVRSVSFFPRLSQFNYTNIKETFNRESPASCNYVVVDVKVNLDFCTRL